MKKPSKDVQALVPVIKTAVVRVERSIVEDFWAGKSPGTIRAYRDDLMRIASWAGASSIEAFAVHFFAAGPGAAYREANAFKGWAIDRGWSPSYVNNHLAALRSLVRYARRIEHIEWTLDIEGVKVETYKDTRGPGFEGMVAVVSVAEAQDDPWSAARDTAILMFYETMGLRLFEVVGLDVEHVKLRQKRIFVQRKKKAERVFLTVPDETIEAVEAWLVVRGSEPGPLFTSRAIGRRRADGRLAESSVWAILKRLGDSIGIKVRPHGLRHAAITEILEITGGDIRSAQKFAGHASPNTTTKYDDNLTDVAGDMAKQLSKRIAEARQKSKNERAK